MITEEVYKLALSIVMAYKEQCENSLSEIRTVLELNSPYYGIRNTKIEDSNLTQRCKNVLYSLGLNKYDSLVKDLENLSEENVFRSRNIGRNSFAEIKALCHLADIKMKP